MNRFVIHAFSLALETDQNIRVFSQSLLQHIALVFAPACILLLSKNFSFAPILHGVIFYRLVLYEAMFAHAGTREFFNTCLLTRTRTMPSLCIRYERFLLPVLNKLPNCTSVLYCATSIFLTLKCNWFAITCNGDAVELI